MLKPSRKAAPAPRIAKAPSAGNLGKITAPTLQRVFGNERLFARLDAARFYPVVWVHGPPGAGKTTLAASYLAARAVSPLWCRLDEGDADPASVFLHLSQAAMLDAPDLDLPLLKPEFRTALPLFTRRFFRRLFAADGIATMVLDDYHEVPTGAELHDCLPAGLEEVPQGGQVIIISRSAPPSQLARLRLNGKIDVIEPDALRLNTKEIRALAQERGVDAPPLAEERIAGATQGWTAGVILVLEASAPCPLAAGAATVPVPEVLFDYFAGEILQRMEAWVPAVLSTLALLPTMTAATAEQLTGQPEAGRLLEDLHRRNYFTTRDSAPEPRYRFHPLFRDFLRSAARKSGQDETLLKARAAAVLEADGQADAAVQLLVEAGHSEALAALIKRRAAALVEEGRNDTLTAWLANFSEDQIAADAWLSHWRGAARVGFDPAGAYPHLLKALELFEAADDVTGQFVAWAGAADAVRLHAYVDVARFDPLVEKMHRLLERHTIPPLPGLELSISVSMATALARRTADRTEYAMWRARAHAAAAIIGVPAHSIRLGFAFAIIDLLDGNFTAAAEALDALPDPFTLDHLPIAQWAGLVAHALAMVFGQRPGDLEPFAVEAIKRLEGSGLVLWMPMMASLAAFFTGGRDDLPACNEWRQQAARLAKKAGFRPGAQDYNASAYCKILAGDPTGAKADADMGLARAIEDGYNYFNAHARVMRTNALLAANDLNAAAEELDRLDHELARGMFDSLLFTSKFLRAVLCLERNDVQAEHEALRTTLTFGRQQGAKLAIVLPRTNRLVCKRALELDIEPDFVRTLIRCVGLSSPDPYDGSWPWPIKITTFGGFSIELDGVPLAFSGKTPRKLIALVKAIAAFGGRAVPEARIADALWPDEDADAAFNALSIAIHRLRKLLGDNDAIVVSNGTIGFDPARCWLDVWSLDHLAGDVSGNDPGERGERLLALYKGDFLSGDADLAWAKPARDLWRRRFARAICDVAENEPAAAAIYERALKAAPLSEELVQSVMRRQVGRAGRAAGIAAYERLRATLAQSTGAQPLAASTALYRQLIAD